MGRNRKYKPTHTANTGAPVTSVSLPTLKQLGAHHSAGRELFPYGKPLGGHEQYNTENTEFWSTKVGQAKLRAFMTALWSEGKTYLQISEDIAEETGITLSPQTISTHIKQCIQYWRNQSLLHIDDRKSATLARIAQLEALATDAYFASMQGYSTQENRKLIKKVRSSEYYAELLKKVREHREEEIPNVQRNSIINRVVALVGDHYNSAKTATDELIITEQKQEETSKFTETPAGDPRFLKLMMDLNKQRADLWGLFDRSAHLNEDQVLAQLSDSEREKRMVAILDQAKLRATRNTGALAPAEPLGGFEDGKTGAPVLEADEDSLLNHIPETEIVFETKTQETEELDWGIDEEETLDDLDWGDENDSE